MKAANRLWIGTILLSLLPSLGFSQSLADIARKEKERRKEIEASGVKVGEVKAAGKPQVAEKKVVELNTVRLYLPDDILRQRLSNATILADYIKSLQNSVTAFWKNAEDVKAKGLLLAVGVSPERKARVWCDAVDGEISNEVLARLEKELGDVPPVAVKNGPIAFALELNLWGQKPQNFPETPKAWANAAQKAGRALGIPDELFTVVWPDGASASQSGGVTVPIEFVTQVLEPTGGKILRPKEWFYTESHRENSYAWILSREDASKGSYTTGVRLQAIVGIKQGTGKSPKQFVLDFIDKKKKEATKVIESCAENNQVLFTRICLHTEEGPYHILYSLFWGNNIDIVFVSIAGTTKELWETYVTTFDKMSAIELIDMKRFDK